jgi:hypothetical protein
LRRYKQAGWRLKATNSGRLDLAHLEGRCLLREGSGMKFGFIAKHRTIWPVAWLCDALGVSRSGFHAWSVGGRQGLAARRVFGTGV